MPNPYQDPDSQSLFILKNHLNFKAVNLMCTLKFTIIKFI